MILCNYHWNDEEKQLSVFDRETGGAIYQSHFSCFVEAKKVADAFDKTYSQGARHGKQLVLEEFQRTVDHINRNI